MHRTESHLSTPLQAAAPRSRPYPALRGLSRWGLVSILLAVLLVAPTACGGGGQTPAGDSMREVVQQSAAERQAATPASSNDATSPPAQESTTQRVATSPSSGDGADSQTQQESAADRQATTPPASESPTSPPPNVTATSEASAPTTAPASDSSPQTSAQGASEISLDEFVAEMCGEGETTEYGPNTTYRELLAELDANVAEMKAAGWPPETAPLLEQMVMSFQEQRAALESGAGPNLDETVDYERLFTSAYADALFKMGERMAAGMAALDPEVRKRLTAPGCGFEQFAYLDADPTKVFELRIGETLEATLDNPDGLHHHSFQAEAGELYRVELFKESLSFVGLIAPDGTVFTLETIAGGTVSWEGDFEESGTYLVMVQGQGETGSYAITVSVLAR